MSVKKKAKIQSENTFLAAMCFDYPKNSFRILLLTYQGDCIRNQHFLRTEDSQVTDIGQYVNSSHNRKGNEHSKRHVPCEMKGEQEK